MLAAKRTSEEKERLFFQSFIEHALNGDERYLDIIKPIILESARFARGDERIYQLDRKYLQIKLDLSKFDKIKEVNDDNLYLNEILDFLQHFEENEQKEIEAYENRLQNENIELIDILKQINSDAGFILFTYYPDDYSDNVKKYLSKIYYNSKLMIDKYSK